MTEEDQFPPPPRVLFVDHTAALSGGEIAMLDLIEHLDRLRCTPLVVLCSEGAITEKLAEAGIEYHILPLAPSVIHTRKDGLGPGSLTRLKDIARILTYSRRLARFIREHRIDLVHTNSLKADFLGGLAARLAGRPVIWHVRDRIDADYLPRSVVHAFRWLCRLIPHCVIANSQATLETLRLPRRRHSAVVYSGIPSALTEPAASTGPDSTRPPRDPATDEIRIGLIGRIARWKGQHLFLQAAASVRRRFPSARFLIIGAALFEEREYEREVRDLVSSLGLDGAVEFTGFRADVHEWIAGLDILVHASISGEPFGKVVVEGMAAGKPVVATDGGGVPEIIEDGVTGLLVPMGDAEAMAEAMMSILSDPAAAQEMGRRGRARVRERFTIDRAARQVERVYEQVLHARLPPPPARKETTPSEVERPASEPAGTSSGG